MEAEMKLAVLIDAENISSKYIEVILGEANALGNVIYKRIYGNWTTQNMSSWRDVILDNSIQPIQQYSNALGKNSSDSSLIIDAMDLLYLGKLNGFCIISSDSDFTRLAARLRESEMYVLGMGEQKTPRSFISACNKFSYLDIIYNTNKKAVEQGKQSISAAHKLNEELGNTALTEKHPVSLADEQKKDTTAEGKAGSNIQIVKASLRQLTEENSDDDGWIFSGKLGGLLNKQFPDFDVRNFGFKRFFPFIDSLGLFESRKDDEDKKLIYFKLR